MVELLRRHSSATHKPIVKAPPNKTSVSALRRVRLWIGVYAVISGFGCAVDVEPGSAPPGAIGSSCTTIADCSKVTAPVCLSLSDNGYCSASCALGGQTVCPTGSICMEFPGDLVLCMDGCLSNKDCRSGFVCAPATGVKGINVKQFGVCLAKCKANSDCGFGEACHFETGKCVPKVGGDGKTGHTCTVDTKCNQEMCLLGWPGGYCTATCTGGGAVSCEPGSVCHTVDALAGLCLASCSDANDCRPGYRCEFVEQSPVGGCVPRCDAFDDCPDGFHCNPEDGNCVAGPAGPQPIGAFCDTSSHCSSGQCKSDWPNGTCTTPCSSITPCVSGVCVNALCVAACTSAYDCRPDYACGSAGGCLPHCRTLGCAKGETCDSLSGLCHEPNTNGLLVETLFSSSVDTSPTGGPPTTLNLPEDSLSLSLYGGDGTTPPTRLNFLGRVGEVPLHSLASPLILSLPLYSTGNPDFSVMLPQAPSQIPTPGPWTVSVSRLGLFNSSAPLTAVVLRGNGPPESGRISFNFHFVGVTGITAKSAATNLFMQSVINKVRNVFAEAYLDLGEVRFYDINSSDAERLSVINTIYGANSEFAELMELSKGDPHGIDIFLVDEILGNKSGFSLLGLSGGIPGPAIAHGLASSGVVIALGFYFPQVNKGFKDQQVRQLGQTIAHETGHYLGLFHTSEGRGTKHDPLSDTQKCLPKNDKNGDGYLFGSECTGKGAENLMFWAASAAAEQITLEQRSILLRNPFCQLPHPTDTEALRQ